MSGRILSVGNSFIGAVMQGLREDVSLAGGYRFDFAGAAGTGFARIRLKNGHLVNTTVATAGGGDIGGYDAAFVYADLPSAHHLAHGRRSFAKQRYSRQAIEVALEDWINASTPLPIYRAIRSATRVPVGILSANASTELGTITEDEYRGSIAVLRRVLGEDYVETPRAAFTADFGPDDRLYKGSVDIAGASLGGRPGHYDVTHLNAEGGKVILAGLVAWLRAAMPADAPPPAAIRDSEAA
jgi:hypothetical protein